MTITLWDGLDNLNFLVGADFPEADEDALWRCAQAWLTAAAELRELSPDATAAGSSVVEALGGEAGPAFAELWREFEGGDGFIERLARACEELGAACDTAAIEVEYAKLQYIAALVALGITLASLTAALWAGGVSALGMPAAIAAAQFTIRLVLVRLVTAAVVGSTVNVTIDALAQAVQRSAGHRTGWDLAKTWRAAEDGAIFGAAGGGVFLAGARLAPGLMSTAMGLLGAAGLTGAAGGLAAPLAHGETPTGRDFTMAMTSGIAGGLTPDLARGRMPAPDLSRLAALDPGGLGARQWSATLGQPWLDGAGQAGAQGFLASGPDRVPDGAATGPFVRVGIITWAGLGDDPGPPAVAAPAVPAAPATVAGVAAHHVAAHHAAVEAGPVRDVGSSASAVDRPGDARSQGTAPAHRPVDVDGGTEVDAGAADVGGAAGIDVDGAADEQGGQVPPGFVTDDEALVMVQRSVFGTDAGLAFYAVEDEIRDFARAVHPTDGYLTLDLHGSPEGFQIDDQLMTPEQFALALGELRAAGTMHLADGVGIKLLSCDTAVGGENSAAARLARALGVEVIAPDQPVWTALDGEEIVASPVFVDGALLPADPPDGRWHRFGATGAELPLSFAPGYRPVAI